MARHAAVHEGLRKIDPDRLRLCSKVDEYHYAWRRALLALDSDPEESLKRAAQAVLLTAPEHASIAKPGVPQLAAMAFGLWRPLVERDAPKFNAALAAALEAYRDFWGSEAPNNPDHWCDVRVLALCCLAHDRGIAIDVESDYLLPALFSAAPPRSPRFAS